MQLAPLVSIPYLQTRPSQNDKAYAYAYIGTWALLHADLLVGAAIVAPEAIAAARGAIAAGQVTQATLRLTGPLLAWYQRYGQRGQQVIQQAAPETPQIATEVQEVAIPAEEYCSAEIQVLIDNAIKSADKGVRLEGTIAKFLIEHKQKILNFRLELGPNGSIGEIDIETRQAIIEVFKGEQGKYKKVMELVTDARKNPLAKQVIL